MEIPAKQENSPVATDVSPKFYEICFGYATTQSLYVAAKLEIADHLAKGPLSADQLAQATGADIYALRTVLRALSRLDVLSEDSEGRLRLTPLGELLKVGSATRNFLLQNVEGYYGAMSMLLACVKDGKTALRYATGMNYYEYNERHNLSRLYDSQMLNLAPARYSDVPKLYDLTRFAHVIDVGGNQGGLARILLKAHPGLRVTVLDAPHVIAGAEGKMREEGFGDNCQFVGGDFFKSVPEGGDLYVTASVLSNWRDDEVLMLLKNIRRAMKPSARFIQLEPADFGQPGSAGEGLLLVWNMAIQGGIRRTPQVYKDLLDKAGFAIGQESRMAHRDTYCLIEAVPL